MAETDFKYDVFISYSHKDEEWVRNILLPTLENQGLKVCIDYRDFLAGKAAIINMQDASEASRHTILVLTPKWVESEWTLYESILSRTDDPSGLQRRTIPLLLEKCKPPKFISMLSWVDFTDKQRENEAWQNLFKSLDKEVEKIEIERGSVEDWYIPHPYPMPPNFTGRAAELKMLDDWLVDDKDRLLILRALGGFGKSALAWQWINTHVNPPEWTRLVWWSFYEGDDSFEHFIEETLKYLQLEVPPGHRPQVDTVLKAIQSQKILLIIDGFERALRAYSNMNAAYQADGEPKLEANQLDCVNINAEWFLRGVCSLPNIKGKVLMTTRLTPRAIKLRGEFLLGCCEVELTAIQPADAVEFLHRQKIKGTHAEIEAACASYGYHPLSLRLLAGRILKDFENPADIVIARKLKLDGDLKAHQHHILEVAYSGLTPQEQKLLSTIACFRSPVELKALEAIATNKDSLNDDLRDLIERGLVQFYEKNKKFDLHPIVRHYSYSCLGSTDRTNAHSRLVNYFETLLQPKKEKTLEVLALMIELYHHRVSMGKFDEAIDLFVINNLSNPLFYQLGAYQRIIEMLLALFPDREDTTPRLKDINVQGWTLNMLAMAYGRSGQADRAVAAYQTAVLLEKKLGSKNDLAIILMNLSIEQLSLGKLRDAKLDLHRSISLCHETNDEAIQAIGHRLHGRLLSYCGKWRASEQELDIAATLVDKANDYQSQGLIASGRVQRLILRARANPQSSGHDYGKAFLISYGAVLFAHQDAKRGSPKAVNSIQAYWLYGAGYRAIGSFSRSEELLSRAIHDCRAINLVEYEADILLDLARLRYGQKNYEEARSLAEEALTITERCGYVLQGADVNLFLAQHALKQEKDKAKAKEHAETALKLAYCDGPPYYYKVAYQEAERMLENLEK
jgi:tetratricopeptide (TPR) repeat protein